MTQDDQHLVTRVIKGDEKAFLALYDRYASRVYGLTLRVLGDTMLAEEVTQDTFLKLWSRARQFDSGKGELAPWLLTIAHRTALDRLRLEKRRLPASNARDPEETWPILPDKSTQSSEARWRSLYFAVQSLPEEQRQVIDLAYYKSMSQSEIAEVLGWPLGTVKTRVRAAMQSLREHWLEEYVE
ncbi:MAG: sigma-70 family RNA polymerase sigma factor [Anaerolineales bacterium]|jgi:RNA polymerase sigma-70 factor (ECF subfamily)